MRFLASERNFYSLLRVALITSLLRLLEPRTRKSWLERNLQKDFENRTQKLFKIKVHLLLPRSNINRHAELSHKFHSDKLKIVHSPQRKRIEH